MTVIATALKHLMAAGLAGDALVAAIEEIEEQMRPRRSSNAARQAAYRERQRAAEDVTDNVTNITDVTLHNGAEVSPKKSEIIPPSHSPPLRPPFPISEALAVWNAMAKRAGLAQAQTATGKRQAMLRQRLAEHGEDGFRKAVDAVERSKFCRGDNDRGWRADIGFLLRPDNFVKLIEGGFDKAGDRPAERQPMTAEELKRGIRRAEDNDDPDRAAQLKAELAGLQAAARPPPVSADPKIANVIASATDKMRLTH